MRRRSALGGLAGGLLAGCVRKVPDTPGASVPLARLPIGGRVQIMVGDEPVEVRRLESGVEARSMLCTHFGCSVAWNEAAGLYLCPCHEGRFDAQGRVVSGAPTKPLRTLAARVIGEEVRVDAEAPP